MSSWAKHYVQADQTLPGSSFGFLNDILASAVITYLIQDEFVPGMSLNL